MSELDDLKLKVAQLEQELNDRKKVEDMMNDLRQSNDLQTYINNKNRATRLADLINASSSVKVETPDHSEEIAEAQRQKTEIDARIEKAAASLVPEPTPNIPETSVEEFKYGLGHGGICIDKYIGFSDAVNVPSMIEGLPVTAIGNKAFERRDRIKQIIIPSTVTMIGDRAFINCYFLMNIDIPDAVTTIGKRAFAYCTRSNSLKLPKSLTTIDDEAFSHCRNIKSVIIPDSVKTIGKKAFAFCDKLVEASVPSTALIKSDAFIGCDWHFKLMRR